MSLTDPDLQQRVEQYEAGVSDLIAAYELAEEQYFAAVDASTPRLVETVASNSSSWVSDADLG